MMKRAVVALPDHDYYLWQMLVQAKVLVDAGWEPHYLVYTGNPDGPSEHLRGILEKSGLNITVWNDPRPDTERSYNPAMKPWLVGTWLLANPHMNEEPFYLLDPDAVPTGAKRLPNAKEGVLYGTDTDGYTGPDYLKSKGTDEQVWKALCGIAGVDPQEAAKYPGIGAQYLVNRIPVDFWFDVAGASEDAHAFMESTKDEHSPEDPVQAWCAEMYMMQLVAIRYGVEPRSVASMSMMWADGAAEDWGTKGFFHDAGLVKDNGKDFFKLAYQESPWGEGMLKDVDKSSASARYVAMIRDAGEHFADIVW